MKLFLMLYDRQRGQLRSLREYPDTQREHAEDERLTLELDHPDLEVVLLEAASEADLQKTHSRYFWDVRELAGQI
jgi:hypothetical protein